MSIQIKPSALIEIPSRDCWPDPKSTLEDLIQRRLKPEHMLLRQVLAAAQELSSYAEPQRRDLIARFTRRDSLLGESLLRWSKNVHALP